MARHGAVARPNFSGAPPPYAQMIYRARHRCTPDQKETVWTYVCGEISGGRLLADAVVFSSGVDGARHPSVDLNRLSDGQLETVCGIIA